MLGGGNLIAQAETITGGAGSFTINLGGSAVGNTSNLTGTLTVTDTGTAATDSLILNNLGVDSTTALNIDSFNGKDITSSGYESVSINTGKIAAGAAQTIGTLTLTSDTVAAPTSLTVTGKNAFTLTSLSTNSTDVVTVDASGLTAQIAGTPTLTISGTTSGTAGKQKIIGSAGEDSITVGNFAATIEGGDSNDTITGGTANDSLLGGDGIDTIDTNNGNNTVNGGNGNDVITAGTGNDSLLGAADDDKFNMGSNLTSADTIDGGTGTNTLTLASLGFASTGFANVSNIQTVGITGTTLVTLSSPISSTAATFDLSSAEAGQLTFASGYTGAVTVLETNGTAHNGTNIDVITNTANIALTVKGDVADLNTVNITGGSATDTIELTADDGTASLTNTSGIDTITILAGATSTKDAIITNAVVASGKVLTVNASALTDSTAAFSFAAKASQLGSVSVTGGAGVNTINLTNLAGNNTVTGSANDDVITGGTGNDSLSGGAGSDTYTMSTGLTNGDNIVDSTGTTDTLTATINGLTATTGAFNISGVETITLATATAASTIDATGIIGASLLAFTGAQGVTVTKLGAGATVGFGSAGTAYTGIANLSLASSVGIADVLNLKLNTTATQTVGTITTAGIETVNFTQTGVAAGNQVLDLSLTAANTITLSASTVNGNSRNYTLGTLNTATTLLDASGDLSTGQLIVIGSSTATTFKGSAGANNITGGALGDTITIATAYDVSDTVAGGTGTDTLNATFTVAQAAMDFTKVSAVEIYNLTIDPTLDIVVADSGATGTTGLMDATTTTVNVIGGTTGSFTAITDAFSTGARFTAGTGTFDASQFGGTVDIAAAATGFILGDKYVGGTGTADVLRVQGSTSTFGAVTVSNFETIEFSGITGNSSFDMTNVTGVSNFLLTGTMSQTVTNLAAGVTVSLGANTAQAVNSLANTVADAKTFTIGRIASSTSGTADALTVNLNDEASIFSGMTLVANGIEALTFNQTTVTGKNFSLAINDTNATNPVALTFTGGFATAGTNTTTIRSGGIEANVTSIDASGSSDNFVMATGARAGSTAMTITGGSGSDTLIMKHANDSLTGGTGTSDTLSLVFSTLGGQNTVVDLSAADQITSLKSSSNAAIQVGFESVTGAGITGLGSLDITGSSVANTLTGSLNADLINGGAGDDIIIGGAGADDLTGGTGLDTFYSDNTGTVTTWNIGIDTINDLGTGGRNTTALANAAITGINGDVLKFSNADLAALTGFSNASAAAYVIPTGANGTTIKLAALITGAGAPSSSGTTAQFLYNSTDGALYFDADGGAGAADHVQVAILATGLTLTVTDFLIVA